MKGKASKRRDFLCIDPVPPDRDYAGWVFPERCENVMRPQVTVEQPTTKPTDAALRRRRTKYDAEYHVPEKHPDQWALSERIEDWSRPATRSQPARRSR